MLEVSIKICARMPIARASTHVSDAARQIRSTIPAAVSGQRSEHPHRLCVVPILRKVRVSTFRPLFLHLRYM